MDPSHIDRRREEQVAALVGKRLAFARKSLRLTQTDVGEALGLAKESVSRIEQGNTVLSLMRLAQFCDVLKLRLVDVLSDAQVSTHPLDEVQPLMDALIGMRPDQRQFVLKGAMDLVRLAKGAPAPGDD